MSAVQVNDKFLELMSSKEPLLYNTFKDTQFIVAKGNENEIKLFFSMQLFNDAERQKIVSLFREALNIAN